MPAPTALANPQGNLAAALWMVGTILSFSSLAVAVRELSANFEPFQIQFLRSLIGLLIIASLVFTRPRVSLISRQWRLTVTRNVIHVLGQVLWTMGIGLLPLAIVFALEFTSPIWATLMAVFILGERLTIGRFIAIVCGFAGILVIVRPGFDAFDPAMLLVLLAAIAFGFINIATKRLTQTDAPSCIMFWMCLMQALILLPLAILVWQPLIASAWPWVMLLGASGLSAHYCLSRALQLADAITVLPMEYLRLPMIGLVGAALYNEALDVWIYLGGVLIFLGVYLNLRRERKRSPNV